MTAASRLFDRAKGAVRKRSDRWKKARDRHPDLLDDPKPDNPNPESPDPNGVEGISNRERRIIKTLQFCLFIALGYFIILNVRPYLGFADEFTRQWGNTGIFAMLLKWPIVGWLLGQGIALTSFFIGFILWASLQIFELLPSVMSDSPQMILSTLARIKDWRKLTVKAEDSAIARQLKTKYNAIPEAHIETANLFRAGAYLMDGAICIAYYAPIEGGWGNLETMFVSGDFSYLKWDSIISIIVTLFAVEVVYFGFRFASALLENHYANN